MNNLEQKLPAEYYQLKNAPFEEKMGSFIKRHNVDMKFRTKNGKTICHAYFPNEDTYINSCEEDSVIMAYNSVVIGYILYLEELEDIKMDKAV